MDAKDALRRRMRGETAPTVSPEEHFNQVRGIWYTAFSEIRLYLMRLDGNTSRAVGALIQKILNERTNESDWPTTGAARFIHNDPDLWHEVANSRKN